MTSIPFSNQIYQIVVINVVKLRERGSEDPLVVGFASWQRDFRDLSANHRHFNRHFNRDLNACFVSGAVGGVTCQARADATPIPIQQYERREERHVFVGR